MQIMSTDNRSVQHELISGSEVKKFKSVQLHMGACSTISCIRDGGPQGLACS